jgi:hypothetical protein
MAKGLTARSIERLKPDSTRRLEIPDGLLPGLYFVVQPTGARSWAVRYRHSGKSRKHTLGSYPVVDLGSARAMARAALQAVALGRDPGAEKQALRRVPRQPHSDRFSTVVELYRKARPKEEQAPHRRGDRTHFSQARPARMG